jgi:hypothetical protein
MTTLRWPAGNASFIIFEAGEESTEWMVEMGGRGSTDCCGEAVGEDIQQWEWSRLDGLCEATSSDVRKEYLLYGNLFVFNVTEVSLITTPSPCARGILDNCYSTDLIFLSVNNYSFLCKVMLQCRIYVTDEETIATCTSWGTMDKGTLICHFSLASVTSWIIIINTKLW